MPHDGFTKHAANDGNARRFEPPTYSILFVNCKGSHCVSAYPFGWGREAINKAIRTYLLDLQPYSPLRALLIEDEETGARFTIRAKAPKPTAEIIQLHRSA